MKVLGIDGCKAGWCVVSLVDGVYNLELLSNFSEIKKYHNPDVVLVDMPIGLGSQDMPRDLDDLARKRLPSKRHASIFIPPIREAIEAENYQAAKEINQKITGKKISIQSWNITKKIWEVDQFLLSNPEWQKRIHEAHPELSFNQLNMGKDLIYNKKSAHNQGIQERIEILSRFEKKAPSIITAFKNKYPSKQIQNDDIVDAFCLAITAKLGFLHCFQKIVGNYECDANGIEMSLYYYNPKMS